MTKYKDNNTYSQNNTNSALERYAMEGYTPPAGVVGKAAVKEMQRWLGGLTVDGIWGPRTQKQFDKAMATVLKTTQVPPAPADAERLGYAEDLYKLSLGIGKSGLGNYMVRGYDPPANIKSAEDVRAFQASHGLDVNGVWGRRTQQKFDQLQQQWAGQYDIDEIARLVAEGLNKLTGAAGSAAPEGVIPLGTGKETGIIQMSSGSARPGQIMGAQTGAKPVTSSAPTTMENRAAKGYTIPQGVDDVAAAQRMLGVEVDGVWGGETDRAYKKLVSGGGNPHISSAQAVAAQLKQLYQDVAASNLSMGEKAEAIALLAALEQYGDPEYQRKTLLGIQMKGGAAAFFKQPSGPAWNAMIDTQNELYEDLLGRLEQKKNEIAQIPIWERIFSNAEYKELQSQRTELEEQIMVVDKRLRQPGWNVLTFWDWSEVEDWERAQLAGQNARGNASAEKQARDEAAAEAKAKAGENITKPRFTYQTLENKNRARNDSAVKAFVGTIIGEIEQEASEQYKKGEELTTAKAVAFVIMNCLQYQDLGYQQYNTVETVAKRYFGGFEGKGMDSFTAYLEDDYKELARLQNNTSEEYVKARVVPLYDAVMKAVLPILDGIDNEDFTNGARHIFSPEQQSKQGRDTPKWVSPDNEVIVDSLDGYDLKIYLE